LLFIFGRSICFGEISESPDVNLVWVYFSPDDENSGEPAVAETKLLGEASALGMNCSGTGKKRAVVEAAVVDSAVDGESTAEVGARGSGSKIAIGPRRNVLRSMGRKALTKRQQEDILRHRRCGHFHIPGCSVIFCDSCAVAKSEGISHGDVRPENQLPEEWLHRVSWDFCGNFQVSYEGNCILLIAETQV